MQPIAHLSIKVNSERNRKSSNWNSKKKRSVLARRPQIAHAHTFDLVWLAQKSVSALSDDWPQNQIWMAAFFFSSHSHKHSVFNKDSSLSSWFFLSHLLLFFFYFGLFNSIISVGFFVIVVVVVFIVNDRYAWQWQLDSISSVVCTGTRSFSHTRAIFHYVFKI